MGSCGFMGPKVVFACEKVLPSAIFGCRQCHYYEGQPHFRPILKGGTIDSAVPCTSKSDTGGTFNPLLSYESLTTEKNKRGQDVIIYTKTMDDGITFYVEEIRLGRHELAASTMYKRKKDDSPTLID